MEVTVIIPDQFAKRLVPAGKTPSQALLEKLVAGAYGEGRIDAEQANEILGRKAEIKYHPDSGVDEILQSFFDRYLDGEIPEWINDLEQVKLHAIAAKLIGCLGSSTMPQSTDVGKAVKDSLEESYERAQHSR